MHKKKKIIVVVGLALSCGLLAVVLWRIDWNIFVSELRYLRSEWLLVGFVCLNCGSCLRALRWNVLLDPYPREYRAFWEATCLGLAANQLYPFRAGEVIRILAIKRFLQLPLGSAVTSAIVDRLGDVGLLGISAAILTFSYVHFPHAEAVRDALVIAASVVVLAALILGRTSGRNALRVVIRWSAKRSANLQDRMENFYDDSLGTLKAIYKPGRIAAFALVMLGMYVADCLAFLCVAYAFGWDLPWLAIVSLWLFLGVATSLPSAPANAGIFQVACVLALGLFDINESQAIAYSIVLQILAFMSVLLMAGLALVGHRSDIAIVKDAIDLTL